ncbi:MAG: hypothetical protein ACRDTG_00025 [Pseudonocardiaceae bacterium]
MFLQVFLQVLLLGRLQARTLEQCVTDLIDIAREVQADFDELHRDGVAWQRPQFLIDRGWDGSTLFGKSWVDTSASRPLRLGQEAWDQLCALLSQRSLPLTYDAYRWAFDVTGCAPLTTTRPPAEHLMDLIRDLDNRQGGRCCSLRRFCAIWRPGPATRTGQPRWAPA